MAKLILRITLGPGQVIGPGKIRLLELIRETGSISAAGRAMRMSYRRAWLHVDKLNRSFCGPVVTTSPGGSRGGGTSLTALGETIVAQYRAMEKEAEEAVQKRLDALSAELAGE